MFKILELIKEKNELKRESLELYKEKKRNENYIEILEQQKIHAKLLAEYTITQLNKLEIIDRSGNTEERKRQERNMVYNNLIKRNLAIKKELSSKLGSGR